MNNLIDIHEKLGYKRVHVEAELVRVFGPDQSDPQELVERCILAMRHIVRLEPFDADEPAIIDQPLR